MPPGIRAWASPLRTHLEGVSLHYIAEQFAEIGVIDCGDTSSCHRVAVPMVQQGTVEEGSILLLHVAEDPVTRDCLDLGEGARRGRAGSTSGGHGERQSDKN